LEAWAANAKSVDFLGVEAVEKLFMVMLFKSEACLMSIQMCGQFLGAIATVTQ
jgi:hypothetical protein